MNAKATTRTARVPAKIPPMSLPLTPGVEVLFDGIYDTDGVGVFVDVGALWRRENLANVGTKQKQGDGLHGGR